MVKSQPNSFVYHTPLFFGSPIFITFSLKTSPVFHIYGIRCFISYDSGKERPFLFERSFSVVFQEFSGIDCGFVIDFIFYFVSHGIYFLPNVCFYFLLKCFFSSLQIHPLYFHIVHVSSTYGEKWRKLMTSYPDMVAVFGFFISSTKATSSPTSTLYPVGIYMT